MTSSGILRKAEEQLMSLDFRAILEVTFLQFHGLYSIPDRNAQTGKVKKITEYDINTTQCGVQADYVHDLLPIVFNHPSVKSFLVWGFWAGRHWRPDAAFYTTGWTLLPYIAVWKDLIYNQWWTKKN